MKSLNTLHNARKLLLTTIYTNIPNSEVLARNERAVQNIINNLMECYDLVKDLHVNALVIKLPYNILLFDHHIVETILPIVLWEVSKNVKIPIGVYSRFLELPILIPLTIAGMRILISDNILPCSANRTVRELLKKFSMVLKRYGSLMNKLQLIQLVTSSNPVKTINLIKVFGRVYPKLLQGLVISNDLGNPPAPGIVAAYRSSLPDLKLFIENIDLNDIEVYRSIVDGFLIEYCRVEDNSIQLDKKSRLLIEKIMG